MKVTYISWAASCSRSDHTARELGGASHMVYWGWLGSHPATVLLKYAGQFLKTWHVLAAERPDAVFVMTPPVVAVLAVASYAAIARVPFVIDLHTAALLHPRWRRLEWLQHAMCRRAATTIVTNEHLARMIESRGGHTTIVADVPVVYSVVENFPRPESCTIAVVCSFNYDEPVAQILQAAARLPDVHFYVTGNPKHLDAAIARSMPPNARLTGFLSDAAYGGLLTCADAVMTLTTRDHTMLRGAYEAIYQGTPVIVSDWPLLRRAFDRGALHVDNTAGGIESAVRELQASHGRLKQEALELRDRKRDEWGRRKLAILARITAPGAAGARRARPDPLVK